MRTAWKKAATMAIVMGCGAIIAAQNERPEQSTSTTSAAQSKPAMMMVTGCVQRAEPAGATGTSGAASAATRPGAASEFTLTNAVISTGGSASTTTGATSTTTGTATATTDAPRAATPAATSGSTYTLDDPANKLVAHVGHKVEVRGTLAPSATASASGSTARASAGQRLSVSEVKMISADCSAK